MLIDRNVTGKMLVMLVIEKACTTVVRAMVKRDRAAVCDATECARGRWLFGGGDDNGSEACIWLED